MSRRESPLATWERNRAFHRTRRTYGRHVKLAGIVRRAAHRIARRRRRALNPAAKERQRCVQPDVPDS